MIHRALALVLVGMACAPARAQAPAPPDEMMVAVYLPGLYIPQPSTKVALAAELAEHLSRGLGRPVTSRVYATWEALEGDIPRITIALLEAPYIAARLRSITALCTAAPGGRDETHLVVMAGPGVARDATDLRGRRLAYAEMPDDQVFLETFLFDGEVHLDRERLQPARDAGSALSKILLKKADAVLLYEDDAAAGQRAGLQAVLRSGPLPRPALVVFDRNYEDSPLVPRMREIMSRFAGKVHPPLAAFRPAVADRYLALMGRVQQKGQHLPPLADPERAGLTGLEEWPLRLLPAPGVPLAQPPLRAFLSGEQGHP